MYTPKPLQIFVCAPWVQKNLGFAAGYQRIRPQGSAVLPTTATLPGPVLTLIQRLSISQINYRELPHVRIISWLLHFNTVFRVRNAADSADALSAFLCAARTVCPLYLSVWRAILHVQFSVLYAGPVSDETLVSLHSRSGDRSDDFKNSSWNIQWNKIYPPLMLQLGFLQRSCAEANVAPWCILDGNRVLESGFQSFVGSATFWSYCSNGKA